MTNKELKDDNKRLKNVIKDLKSDLDDATKGVDALTKNIVLLDFKLDSANYTIIKYHRTIKILTFVLSAILCSGLIILLFN